MGPLEALDGIYFSRRPLLNGYEHSNAVVFCKRQVMGCSGRKGKKKIFVGSNMLSTVVDRSALHIHFHNTVAFILSDLFLSFAFVATRSPSKTCMPPLVPGMNKQFCLVPSVSDTDAQTPQPPYLIISLILT